MNAFTIRDIENLSGIKAHTIRIWEQRYSFLKPGRSNTNIRYYNNEEVKLILNIALLNKHGFKISRLAKMQPQEVSDKISFLNNSATRQDRNINELIQKMIDLDINDFTGIINNSIKTDGIQNTIMQLLFPYLERIGILWQTGNINAAQEHLVAGIIKQKIIAAIEYILPARNAKTALLFLPEGEYHDLGLLLINYLLQKKGIEVIYLGANVPLKDVEYVVNLKKPDFIFVHFISTAARFNFQKFLLGIERSFNNTPAVISGAITHTYKKKIPRAVSLKQSLPQVIQHLNEL